MGRPEMTPEQAAAALANRERLQRKAEAMTAGLDIRRARLGRAALRWIQGARLQAFSFVNLADQPTGEDASDGNH
jgi:hypothetical protein